jgi:hypothetical protein
MMMKRIGKWLIAGLATLYFVADALFSVVSRPLSAWLERRRVFNRLRAWLRTLNPYTSLAIFLVPVLLLEPVKPLAAYLAATHHVVAAAFLFGIGEILKLVLVERLFAVCRYKLLTIPAFAWAYGKYVQAKEFIASTSAYRSMKYATLSIRRSVRSALLSLRTARRGDPLAKA